MSWSATEDHRVKVTLCRAQAALPDADILWDDEIRLPLEDDLILSLAEIRELYPPGFRPSIRKAGFDGKANAVLETKPVPEEIGNALHLITQFAAARELHQLLKKKGDLPERLAALARIASRLGLLSEHFWFQGEGFQALKSALRRASHHALAQVTDGGSMGGDMSGHWSACMLPLWKTWPLPAD